MTTMGSLLKGRELRQIFDTLCPFDEDLNLKPASERITLLAANSNNWWETRAFVMLSAVGDQSPIIVQFSHNSNTKIGGLTGKIFMPEGVGYHGNAALYGAKANIEWITTEAEAFGADLVAVSLDHFAVPKFDPDKEYKQRACPTGAADQVEAAYSFIDDNGLTDQVEDLTPELACKYEAYLSSEEYQAFVADFMGTVQIMEPAWGMIDTEDIPPVLDFVITRDIADAVRRGVANTDMMLEAELGATGKSGDEIEYEELSEAELDAFAELAAAFIDYTGAEGIAYDIGMKHAAKAGETHEIDQRKLETVQRRIIERNGVYAPFAQHGGTGSADVAKGLIGKTNVNTAFLVAGSQARYEHFDASSDLVRGGDKSTCGTDVETHVYLEGVYNEALSRIEPTGSYQIGPMCFDALGW
ncbi:MAG: class II fructose-bisphosphate aldolase [Armatimonadota bacterium]|nr:class II fructose-bisphosphate aldolase [Armatimonadota bacterium]